MEVIVAKKAKTGKKADKPKKPAKAVKPKREAKPKKPSRQRKQPSQPAFDGMEQVRNAELDKVCEAIGDRREQAKTDREDEKDDKGRALREMHDKGITSYRWAGVELVRVPGEEKLRVRKSKEDATTATTAEPEPVADSDGGPAGDVDEASDSPF